MKRNMRRDKKCTYSYMEIVRGRRGKEEEENEAGCSAALQENRASNSRMCRKPYFPRPSYLRQLIIVTSITNYVSEERHCHHDLFDVTNAFT